MKNRLNIFFESIWLDNEISSQIINNISWDLIEEELVVKSAIDFILKHKKAANDEVEKKILDIDLDSLIKKLDDLWAIKTFDWEIEDDRYDFESNLFKNEWMICRIRQTINWDYITLKRQVHDEFCDKTWCSKDYEFEIKIDDINKVIDSINNLWLKKLEWKHYKKYRISYKLDWVHFDFDKYDWLPWLLEIESNNEKTVDFWKTKLWLDDFETAQYWYRLLKEHYNL
jgi:adenylate cyclase class IV